jgi:hypothetical protein
MTYRGGCTSDTNPSQPFAYLRVVANWATPIVLSTYPSGLSVPYEDNTTSRFPHPTLANEYHPIEHREQLGRTGRPTRIV